MSLTIDLPRMVEARLEVEAAKAGVTVAEYAASMLQKTLPTQTIDPQEQRQANASSLELLRSRLEKTEALALPEAMAASEEELVTFMHNMNAPRQEAGERLLYPAAQNPQDGV